MLPSVIRWGQFVIDSEIPDVEPDECGYSILVVTPKARVLHYHKVPRRLDVLQGLVGGHIEAVSAPDGAWFCYVNEEGKLLGLDPNIAATSLVRHLSRAGGSAFSDFLVGNVVFVGPVDEQAEHGDVPGWIVEAARNLHSLTRFV